ncbi:MAG TPA: hypothetical protein VMB80_10685 [Candidatus Acidoferrum sp.]|nr:hypothetical protein [Candidatus Acidoferrum sp.]
MNSNAARQIHRVRRLVPGAIFALMLLGAWGAATSSTDAPAIADYSAFRLIADRNIFDPNRYAHTSRSHRQSAARSAPGFSLVGTMTYTNGLIAFFDGSDPDYRKVAAVNDSIAGYQVAAITLNGVKLTSTNKPVELAVGGQMRWEGGSWQLASAGEAALTPAEPETAAAEPSSAPPSSGEPNDVLKKLMQQREQEQK